MRLSLTTRPSLVALNSFSVAQMWLVREAFIESERVNDRLARASDSAVWQPMIDEGIPIAVSIPQARGLPKSAVSTNTVPQHFPGAVVQ
jgi:hypothetical protein